MTIPPYTAGTVTLVNDSAAIVGNDTAWLTALVLGGVLYVEAPGNPLPLATVTGEEAATAAVKWKGASGTYSYAIVRENTAAAEIVNLNDRAAQILIHRFIAGLIPAGEWSSAKVYVTGEYVQHGGRTFGSLVEDNEDNEPPSADEDNASWMWIPVLNGANGIGEGGYGLPVGGTTGQVPAKASNSDGDVEWIDPVADASDVEVTPAGNIAATNVQAALEELDNEKQPHSGNLDEYAAVNPTAAGLALLDDADAAAQRTTMGVVGLTGSETVAGVKTFSSNPIVSGGGIQFPATQVGSSDANCFDDYEEGSYTPIVSFGGGSTGLTYGLQVGRYVKLGRLVYIFGRIQLTAKGSSTGNMRLSGLPFTVENIFGGQNVNQIGYYSNLASMSGPVSGLLPNNDTVFDIYIGGAAGVSQLTHSNFTNTSDFIWSGMYRAA